MNFKSSLLTILHVEHNPGMIKLVKTAFEGFGFLGEMLSAGSYDETLDLLENRARNNEPVHLILVDIHLSDGLGQKLIREVKHDPVWWMTPLIVLQDETANNLTNGAYALGANCVFPKFRKSSTPLTLLQSLYDCWLDHSFLPQKNNTDRVQVELTRTLNLRSRVSDFYNQMAKLQADEPEMMMFWLDRALGAANKLNLLAFFRDKINENDVSTELITRIALVHDNLTKAVQQAEKYLAGTRKPLPDQVCSCILGFIESVDDDVFSEALKLLFSKAPTVAEAYEIAVRSQNVELIKQIHLLTDNADLLRRADALHIE